MLLKSNINVKIKKDLFSKKGNMLKRILKLALKLKLKIAVAAVIVAGIMALALEAPVLHSLYIRNYVGSQVVLLTNKAGNSGGTGFAVKAPSGDVYTLTNAHVCRIEGGLYTTLKNGRRVSLKIVEVSDVTDLCLLSGIKNMRGLDVASGVGIGEEMGLVGHPRLMPLTLSRGQLIGYGQALVLVSFGMCPDSLEPPTYFNGNTPFGPVCVMGVEAGFTNIIALPGNSGSPVVNIFGNVVGVLFASDSEANWGLIVPLSDVKNFLKPY